MTDHDRAAARREIADALLKALERRHELADVVVEFVTPFRDRTLELLEDQEQLTKVLAEGAATAGAVAEATLRDVYDRVGFVPAGR